ncbi:hypothetical protein LDL36_13860 [Komagataeibacter sp. FNDCR1]|nr:hypothetical protein [Komagataeibacter sp. FNDCR1]
MLRKPPVKTLEQLRKEDLASQSTSQRLITEAQTWAATHPNATSEERQFLAAIVAAELAGR